MSLEIKTKYFCILQDFIDSSFISERIPNSQIDNLSMFSLGIFKLTNDIDTLEVLKKFDHIDSLIIEMSFVEPITE